MRCVRPTPYTDSTDIIVPNKTLADSPPYGKVQGFGAIFRILAGDRPPRPADSRWMQDQIWNMIVECWSTEREQRWEIHAVYSQFSVSSIQKPPDVEPGNRYASQTVTWTEGFIF